MNARDWKIVQRVFDQALNTEESEREKLIQEQLDGQPRLEQKVWELLEADAANSTFGATGAAARSLHTLDHLDADSTVGSYKIIRRIGEGGMGSVYLAERADKTFTKQVALKRIRGDLGESAKERFKIERQALAQLEHPNIARLLDGGVDDQSRPYVVMEFVDGHPITAHCDIKNLSVEERLRLFLGLCEAVQHAHQNLIVHRDIKPSNVLVNGEDTVKLLDFGIAKLLGPLGEQHAATATAARVLTPDYASPEQVTGQPIAVTTDVYQLGAMLYELLCGLKPLDTRDMTPSQFEAALLKGDVRPPSQFADRLTDDTEQCDEIAEHRQTTPSKLRGLLEGDLDTIVRKAMAPEPKQRYQSATALAHDIRRYLTELPIEARPASLGYRIGKFVRRNAIGVGVAAVFVLTVVGFSIFLVQQAEQLRVERDVARMEQERSDAVADFLVDAFSQANPRSKDRSEVTASDILQAGKVRVLTELEGNEGLQARLMKLFASISISMGHDQDASDSLAKALGFAQRTPEFSDNADVLVLIGDFASLRSDWAKTSQVVHELESRWADLSHLQQSETYLLKGYIAKSEGRPADSIRLRSLAFENASRYVGPESEVAIRALVSLVSQFRAIGDLQNVRATLNTLEQRLELDLKPALRIEVLKSISTSKKVLGVEPQEHLASQVEIANLVKKIYGPESFTYIEQLTWLAGAYRRNDMYDAAIDIYQQHIEFLEQNAPHRKSSLGTSYLSLAQVLSQEYGDMDKAEAHFEVALKLMEEFGRESPGYAVVLQSYARFLFDVRKNVEKANELATMASQIHEKRGSTSSGALLTFQLLNEIQTQRSNISQ